MLTCKPSYLRPIHDILVDIIDDHDRIATAVEQSIEEEEFDMAEDLFLSSGITPFFEEKFA